VMKNVWHLFFILFCQVWANQDLLREQTKNWQLSGTIHNA